MICDDCNNKETNQMTGLVYCRAKHIECSTKEGAMFCSSYDKDEPEPKKRLYLVEVSATGVARVLAEDEDDAREQVRQDFNIVEMDDYEIESVERV